ncbi:MAG: hypothetical protein ACYDH5_08020 [Acidimicrobiales bacterium]
MVNVPFGTVPGAVALHLRITELLVHGWDLARATGQAVAFPEDVAKQELPSAAERSRMSVPVGVPSHRPSPWTMTRRPSTGWPRAWGAA